MLPKHVRNCFERWQAEGRGAWAPWWIYTAKRVDPVTAIRAPYRCNSWRCEWCAPHEAAVCWRRISDACRPHAAEGWVFLVLTLDRDGYYGRSSPGRVVVDLLSALAGVPSRWGWRSSDDAYSALGDMTEHLRDELRRDAARAGVERTGNRWVAVVEAHRSGWPHVNLLVYAPALAAELRENPTRNGIVAGRLAELVRRAGFGARSTAEPLRRGTDTIAGYITKLVKAADMAAGEVAKITQAPTSAPERFRRLRSGRRFLAPRHSDPTTTGTLVRRQYETDGTVTVLPLHKVSDELRELVQRAASHEEDLAHDELRLLATVRAGDGATAAILRAMAPALVHRVRLKGPAP